MQRVQAGELLLMDAGCELHGYSSDVTRTWPVSGTFSRHQREVYEIVLDTHRCAAEGCKRCEKTLAMAECKCPSLQLAAGTTGDADTMALSATC